MSQPTMTLAFRSSGYKAVSARKRICWSWSWDTVETVPEWAGQGGQGSKVRQRAPSTGAGPRSRMSMPDGTRRGRFDRGEHRRGSSSTARSNEFATAMMWHTQHDHQHHSHDAGFRT